MQLSIIILAYYGEEMFRDSMKVLYGSVKKKLEKDWEIVVVNNGFDKDKLSKIKKEFPKLKFFGSGKNLGFARGNNLGLSKSKGQYILLLNQDVFIRKPQIDELISFLKKNRSYGAVAPRLVYGNGSLQYSCRPFPTFWMMVKDGFNKGKYYRKYYSHKKSQEVDQPMESCVLWRGRILRKLKGFDEHLHFFLYFNDTDLAYRFFTGGGRSYYLSSVKAVHLYGKSTALLKEGRRLSLWMKGLGRYWYKSGDNIFLAYLKSFLVTLAWGAVKCCRKRKTAS